MQFLRRRGRTAAAVLAAVTLFVLFAAANKMYVSASDDNAVLSQKTWSGGSGSEDNWTVNANWAGIGGAGPGDDLVFPENAARKTNSNDFPSSTSFNTLTFTGNGYAISGNTIVLENGMEVNPGAGTPPRFDPNIILANSQSWNSSTNFVELNGIVNLNNKVLTLTGAGDHRFDGTVAPGGQSGVLFKNGSGTAFFNGNASNLSLMRLNDGTMLVQSPGSLGQVELRHGTLAGVGNVAGVDGNVAGAANNGTISPGLTAGAVGTLTVNGDVELASTSRYRVDVSVSNGTDRLVINNGNVHLGGAILDLVLAVTPAPGQQLTILSHTGTGTIDGQFAQGTQFTLNDRIYTLTYTTDNVVLTALPTTITWTGNGSTFNWSDPLNWSPAVAPVDGMSLVFPASTNQISNNNNIQGLDLRAITFFGAGFHITGFSFNVSETITSAVPGSTVTPFINLPFGLTGPATLRNAGPSTIEYAHIITLNGHTLTFDGAGTQISAGRITGVGGVTKNGPGLLDFQSLANNTPNDYFGATRINNGTLKIGVTGLGATSSGSDTIIAPGGSLFLGSNVNTNEPLIISGTGFNNTGALIGGDCATGCTVGGVITLEGNSSISVTSGQTLTVGLISQTGSNRTLTKAGAGKLVLSTNGGNSYNGATSVTGGTLVVNANNGNSPMNVLSGVLAGNGTVGPLTTTGGSVAPGGLSSPATLNVNGNATLHSATTLNVDLGVQSDRLAATGAVNLNGAQLALGLLNDFTPSPGQQFTIVEGPGGISGQFGQGNSVSINGQQFTINYNSTSVVLTAAIPGDAPFDFDGDGKTDIAIFRPAVAEWWYQKSSDNQVLAAQFGQSTDVTAPADYTGDGKTDIAFWRPSTGEWFVLRSENSSFFSFPFGASGDVPAPADYDGDGKADAAVFRPSNSTWFIRRSSDGNASIVQFGTNGDEPVAADYDGDGKADIAIWRSGFAEWWVLRSSDGQVSAAQFGDTDDRPVQGDYTGDGKADIAVWRPSTGFWLVLRSENFSFFSFPFGTTGDVPAPGDFDGDGKFDATVFRPTGSNWFVRRSADGGTTIQQFGISTDVPVPASFIP